MFRPNLWLESWGLKLIALTLAVGLVWAAARSEWDEVMLNQVEVQVINVPRHVLLPERGAVQPAWVSFNIVGPRSELNIAASPDHWVVEIDFGKPDIAALIGDGSTSVNITSDMAKCSLRPSLIKDIQIRSGSFYEPKVLIRTSLAKKTVPVSLRHEGELAAGFVIAATSVTPEQVTISGDPILLERIDAAPTRICYVADLSGDLTDVIGLEGFPEGVTLLSGQNDRVEFTIEVRRE